VTGPAQARADGWRVALAFTVFALLLAAYYLIRPIRDSLVAGLGGDTIKWLSTVVFAASAAVALVFGALVARVPRRWLIPGLYVVFALKLAGFAVLFAVYPGARLVAMGFYVWVAVFNLLMVSTFWSFIADLWSGGGGQVVFGRIAAGGSLGGLAGPLLARSTAGTLGQAGLAGLAAGLLLVAALLALVLMRGEDPQRRLRFDEPVGGSAWAGLRDIAADPRLRRIALLLAGGSLLGMWVYIEVARAAAVLYPEATARTAYFAERDLWVNALALTVQWLLSPLLLRQFGAGMTLMLAAGAVAGAFLGLAVWPTAAVLLLINVGTRAMEFGIAKPARDLVYTGVTAEARYKAKNVLDTVYARACDSVSGWLHATVLSAGGHLPVIGMIGVAVALAQARVARGLRT
jgi:AAA family ATP:ADP antiporter